VRAFWFHNLALQSKPKSEYDDKQLADFEKISENITTKRKTFPSFPKPNPEPSSKRRKSEQSGQSGNQNRTNVGEEVVEELHALGYDVEEPVDFDATDVLVPLNWVCMLHDVFYNSCCIYIHC